MSVPFTSILRGVSMRRTAIVYQTIPIPYKLLLIIACGAGGSLLFTLTYLVEGFTRPGYNAWQQSISALSLGTGGWTQQANFVVYGVITLCTVYAWRKILRGGVGAKWYPILKALEGIGLIVDGVFSQDPAGYLAGMVVTTPSVHGMVHILFAFVTITALAFSCFVMARRLRHHSGWRGWVAYSIITGVLTLLFIAIFGVESSHVGATAGLFERLATGVDTFWSLLFVIHLFYKSRFVVALHQEFSLTINLDL